MIFTRSRKELLSSAMILLFSVTVLSLSLSASQKGKTFLSSPEIHVIDNLNKAVTIWKSSGLKGRVIYHFDENIPVDPMGKVPIDYLTSTDNFLYIAVLENIAREIHYVVPDSTWDRINMNRRGDMPVIRYIAGGTQVTLMKASQVRIEHEPVIISSGGSHWGVDAVLSLTESNVLTSDVLTFSDETPEGHFERLSSIIGTNI